MTIRQRMSEMLHALVFAVVIFILLTPNENIVVIRLVTVMTVVGSWYAGRYRMEWLGLGGLILMFMREASYLGVFNPSIESWHRIVQPFRALSFGVAVLFLLTWMALKVADRYRAWFMLVVSPMLVGAAFLMPSPFAFKALTYVVNYFWYALAAVTIGKRMAEQEGRPWLVSGMIPLIWSPRWMMIPVVLSRRQFVEDLDERYRLQWKGLGLVVLSSALIYIAKQSMIESGGYVRWFWQWFILGTFQANLAVGLAWVAGMRLGIATGNFLNTATLSQHFRVLLRYYCDVLEQFFIAPLFAKLRRIRQFHLRVFIATFIGIFLGGFYIHVTTVLLLRREFRLPPPGMRILVLYPYETLRLPLYFLFIALGVAFSSAGQALRPAQATMSLPRRVLLSLLYFIGYALAVMYAFYPADLDVLWRLVGDL